MYRAKLPRRGLPARIPWHLATIAEISRDGDLASRNAGETGSNDPQPAEPPSLGRQPVYVNVLNTSFDDYVPMGPGVDPLHLQRRGALQATFYGLRDYIIRIDTVLNLLTQDQWRIVSSSTLSREERMQEYLRAARHYRKELQPENLDESDEAQVWDICEWSGIDKTLAEITRALQVLDQARSREVQNWAPQATQTPNLADVTPPLRGEDIPPPCRRGRHKRRRSNWSAVKSTLTGWWKSLKAREEEAERAHCEPIPRGEYVPQSSQRTYIKFSKKSTEYNLRPH